MRYPDTQMRARHMSIEDAHIARQTIEQTYPVQTVIESVSMYSPRRRVAVWTNDHSEKLGYWTNIPSDLGL